MFKSVNKAVIIKHLFRVSALVNFRKYRSDDREISILVRGLFHLLLQRYFELVTFNVIQ